MVGKGLRNPNVGGFLAHELMRVARARRPAGHPCARHGGTEARAKIQMRQKKSEWGMSTRTTGGCRACFGAVSLIKFRDESCVRAAAFRAMKKAFPIRVPGNSIAEFTPISLPLASDHRAPLSPFEGDVVFEAAGAQGVIPGEPPRPVFPGEFHPVMMRRGDRRCRPDPVGRPASHV